MHCVFCALCIHWITRVGDVWRRPSSVFVSYFLFLARLLLVLLATCWVSPVFVWVPPAHAVHLPISFGTEVRRDALFNSSCSTSGVIRCVGMDSYRILCTSVLYPRASPRDRAPSSSSCSQTAFSSSACQESVCRQAVATLYFRLRKGCQPGAAEITRTPPISAIKAPPTQFSKVETSCLYCTTGGRCISWRLSMQRQRQRS